MEPSPPIRWTAVTIDFSDAESLIVFYAELLGWEIIACDSASRLQLRNPDRGVGLNIQAETFNEPQPGPSSPGTERR